MKKRIVLFWWLVVASLGLAAQPFACYQVVEHNTGIPALYNTALDAAACALKTLVTSTGNPGFVVLGYDLYPALAYVDPYETYRERYDKAVSRAEAAYASFVLVTKELGRDGKVAYRVKIKFPRQSPFNSLTPFERQGIEAKVLSALEQKAALVNFSTGANPAVEIAGLEKLKAYFQAVIDQTFSLEGDLLALSGFQKVGFEEQVVVDVTNNNLIGGGNGKIFDFAGISYQGNLIRTAAQSAYSYSDTLFPFDPPALLFTSDDMTYQNGLQIADSLYNHLTFDYILWLHFDTQKDTVYYKTRTNITEEEAQAFVDAYYRYSMQNYWEIEDLYGYDAPNPIAIRENRSHGGGARYNENGDYNCEGSNCWDWKKWKAYCCLIGDDLKDPNNIAAFSPIAFNLGVICGLIDGLYETINLIEDLGAGLKEAASHVPFSGFWFIDVFKSIRKEGDFYKGMQAKFADDKAFVANIKAGVVFFFQNRDQILDELLKSIGQFFENLNPLTGLASTGYAAGKVLFEVLLDFFTGGSATIYKNGAKLSKFTVEAMGMLRSWSQKSAKEIAEDIVEVGLKQTKNGFKKLRCKILYGGCFVAGTPVLALGLQPQNIETLQPGDYIYSCFQPGNKEPVFGEEAIPLQFSKTDFFTSPEQQALDLQSPDTGVWYKLTLLLSQANGTESQAELLRPLTWLEERQIHSIGDEVQIFLPEQGFCGIAGVTSLIPFRFNPPESEKIHPDGLQLSPITGTFTHTSDDVWELIFDHADIVRVTASHPFYSLDAEGWRLAGELRLGERVQSKDKQGILTGATYLPGKYKVYNLEVRTNHNFLVGNSGLLVHNQCKVSELRELVQALKNDPDWVLPLSPGSNVLDKNPDWLTELAKLPDQLPVTNTGPSLQRFIDEVGDADGNIRGELVKAWEKLASLTGTREWTRRSIPLLEKMSGKTDELMEKVKQYYSTHTKPSGTGTPPFTHQGIDFDDFGHPDFFNSIACPGQQYCLKTDNLLGHPTSGLPTDLKPDFNLANQNLLTNGKEINVLHSSGSPILIKIDGKWEGPFTWHHHQDGKTMLPVKEDIHNSMSHTGGDSAIKKLIKGFFTSPF